MRYRRFTQKQREQILERARRADGEICCEGCGLVVTGKAVEIDHIIPERLRPEAGKQQPLKITEGQLLGKDCCHRGANGKTNQDIKRIAKAKRVHTKHHGLNRPKSRWQWRSFSGELRTND